MTVLITGGSGFVGMNIAEELTGRGINVVILARKPLLPEMISTLNEKPGKFEYVDIDILNGERIDWVIKHYSITSIIHAAAIAPGDTSERESTINTMNVNLMGTLEMLEAARKNNINRFVYLSSASVYGDAAFEPGPLSEDKTYPRPNSMYSISKFAGERTVLRYKYLFGMDIVVVRVGATFGPWEYNTDIRDTLSAPFQTTQFAIEGKKALIPSHGNIDWLYSRDAAISLAEILFSKHLTYDTYNLSYGKAWPIQEWCKKLIDEFPDFTFEVVSIDNANISLHGNRDRTLLSIERVQEDLKSVPSFGINESFSDYMNWIGKVRPNWFN